jgi:hypothetical protein
MTEEQKSSDSLMDELQTLGQQLTTAVKALWESEDSRQLRQEIGDGFAELGNQLDSAVKNAQDSEAAKQFGTQVKTAVDQARESDIAGEVERGLVTGLQQLNEELAKLVGSLQGGRSAPAPPEDDTPEA